MIVCSASARLAAAVVAGVSAAATFLADAKFCCNDLILSLISPCGHKFLFIRKTKNIY